jgi:hypothetical protein
MEKQQRDSSNLPDAVSSETQPMRWVAPLRSIKTFSISEFTQGGTGPGTDFLEVSFTQS